MSDTITIEDRTFLVRRDETTGYWYFIPTDTRDLLFGNSRHRHTAKHKTRSAAVRSLRGYLSREKK